MPDVNTLPEWFGAAVIGGVIAALGYVAKLFLRARTDWRHDARYVYGNCSSWRRLFSHAFTQPAGSLWVQSRLGAIHIVELQLLSTVQRQGIGTGVVQDLIQRAANLGASLTLSVVPANPDAKRLYERLGFEVCGHEPPFIHMRYEARPSAV